MTTVIAKPRFEVLRGGVDALELAEAVGLDPAEVPDWSSRLVSENLETEVLARWNSDNESVVWKPTDRLVKGRTQQRARTLSLAGLSARLQFEILANVGADLLSDIAALPAGGRVIARSAHDGGARSIVHLDENEMSDLSRTVFRRWRNRLVLASADPETEWHQDVIRLAVVKPGARRSGLLLRTGDVQQGWLRDLLVGVLQVRLNSIAEDGLSRMCLATSRVSKVLATRSDKGLQPKQIGAPAMNAVVRTLRADTSISDHMVNQTLSEFSSLLTQARAFGLADRVGLPSAFTVRQEHYTAKTKKVREDRGFPDATFRFLMGSDDLLGARVHDLARTVPGRAFTGDLFVAAVQLSANFGRRPEELMALPATRVRTAGDGRAELLYDNFKSGRDSVWLPIDARSAHLVRAWTERVRQEYPETPVDELALFPRSQQNSRGVHPTAAATLGGWFRQWTALLEQGLVLACLHAATRASLSDLCSLRIGDVSHDRVHLGDQVHTLTTEVGQAVVDYRADVLERAHRSKYAPHDLDELPLFPDPIVRVGGQQGPTARGRATEFAPVPAHRFDALGDGWLEIAAQYPSHGIPGSHLGDRRVGREEVQIRLFRHTYLQHLVNLGTDVFLVQELADHTNVQTTIDAYVRVQDEKLREAVERLAEHRMTRYGVGPERVLPLISGPTRDMGTNDCANPQVLSLGNEGCEFDRMCYGCDFIAADPSNIPDIKAEIHTCNLTLARLEAEEQSDLKPHHMAVLRDRRDGWARVLRNLQEHLASLEPAERDRVETAAVIVRGFRDRVRNGAGLNLGVPT